ncbi:MAG: DUF6263 family protein [Bacteroidota bacterium]|nr:DUF6263 family protein [Ferruginibacter sp.]
MKFTKSLTLAATAALFIGSSSFAQTTSGKLGLTKGQKLQVDNSIKSVISQEMAGQSIEISVDANLVHQLEVKDKKDKSYVVASTLKKLSTNGNAMGNSLSFDSDKKEDLESETGKALKDRLNVAQDIELADDAKVINGVKPSTDKPASGGQLLDMINNVTGAGNDNSNGANAAFEVMPAGKKVGDTWSDSSITEEIKTYRNYTLKEIKGDVATVSLTGKQITNKKVEQQGMQITVNMEGKLSGEGFVDMKTGILKERTILLDGTGNIEVMEQSMPMSTKVTTKTTVKSI